MSTNLTMGELRRARFSVASTFLLHAAIFGTWAPRIPAIKEKLQLGNDDLGLALGGLALGLLIGTRLVGNLEKQGRTGLAIKLVMAAQALALIGPAYAWNFASLTVALFVLGLLGGALDVIMNVHAVAVERLYNRPIMSGFHGLWSLGSMIAGGTAAIVARADIAPEAHFLVVALVCAIASVPLLRGLLPADVESATNGHHVEHPHAGGAPVGALIVVVLALMGFGAFLSEGAIAEWSAVFLYEERGASQGFAALGFTVFSAAMAASRLVADRVGQRIGPVSMARGGAVLGVLGYLIFLFVPSPALALAGFVLAGIGIGPAVPVVFSSAGNTRTAKRASVLGITVSAGYLGSVVGPMTIGFVAENVGMVWALFPPVCFLALVVVAAGILGNAAGGRSTDAAAEEATPASSR